MVGHLPEGLQMRRSRARPQTRLPRHRCLLCRPSCRNRRRPACVPGAGWGSPARPPPPAGTCMHFQMTDVQCMDARLPPAERGGSCRHACVLRRHAHQTEPVVHAWFLAMHASCYVSISSAGRVSHTCPPSSRPRHTAYWRMPTKPRVPSMGSSTQCMPWSQLFSLMHGQRSLLVHRRPSCVFAYQPSAHAGTIITQADGAT